MDKHTPPKLLLRFFCHPDSSVNDNQVFTPTLKGEPVCQYNLLFKTQTIGRL